MIIIKKNGATALKSAVALFFILIDTKSTFGIRVRIIFLYLNVDLESNRDSNIIY